MYHHMYGDWNSGWDWLGMILMMVVFLILIAGVVYGAVRLALQHSQKPPAEQ